MNDNMDCPLCLEPLGDATATLKCGHQYCSECLLNSVAKNVGTVEGNTRTQCPMCRASMCDEIEPSAQTATLVENLRNAANDFDMQMDELTEQLQWANLALDGRRKTIHQQRENLAGIRFAYNLILKTHLDAGVFIYKPLLNAATTIQRIWRGHNARGAARRACNASRQAQWDAVGIHSRTVWKLLQNSAARKIQRTWRRPLPASPERDAPYHDALFRAEFDADCEWSDMDTTCDWWNE